MVETVFLLKAHNQPAQVGRLLRRLEVPWAHTLIHVDGKVAAAPFRDRAGAIANASLLPDAQRVPVYWGGFSNAQATLVSLRHALSAFPGARRFVVISGADYPAMALADMREKLGGAAEFVRIDRKLSQSGSGANDRFIQRRNFGDNAWCNERDARFRPAARAARLLGRLVRPRLPRDFEIYHGSDWYGLTRQGAETVLDFYDRRPDLLAFLRQVRSPVEMFVQSALMASPLRDRIADAPASGTAAAAVREHVRGSHFIDWGGGGSHPRTLDLGDFDAIKSSGAFFVRKIDPVKSRKLLDALDAADASLPPD
jgi:hypothetical protein